MVHERGSHYDSGKRVASTHTDNNVCCSSDEEPPRT